MYKKATFHYQKAASQSTRISQPIHIRVGYKPLTKIYFADAGASHIYHSNRLDELLGSLAHTTHLNAELKLFASTPLVKTPKGMKKMKGVEPVNPEELKIYVQTAHLYT